MRWNKADYHHHQVSRRALNLVVVFPIGSHKPAGPLISQQSAVQHYTHYNWGFAATENTHGQSHGDQAQIVMLATQTCIICF